jgi:hypothetical protein
MVAGYAAPTVRTPVGGGRTVADYGPSLAAGANAAKPFTQQGTQAGAQTQADDVRARQYANVDANLKMHALMIANNKADAEQQQDSVDQWASMHDAMQDAADSGKAVDKDGNEISLIKYDDITSGELLKLMQSKDPAVHVTRDQVMPSRVITVPNADGNGTHTETLFTVYNPDGMVAMTDAIRNDNPALIHVPNGQSVPLRVLAQYSFNRNQESLASSGAADHLKSYDEANGTHLADTFNLADAAKKSPLIQRIYPQMNKYRSEDLDQMFADLRKDPKTDPTALASLQQAMGVTNSGLQKLTDARTAAENAAKKGPDAAAPTTDDRASYVRTLSTYANIPADRKNAYAQEINRAATKADLDKVQARIDADDARGQVHADTLNAQRDAKATAFANAGLTANEKLLNDPHTGYFGALAQINQTRAAILAGADGNSLLTNMIPTMEVLGINHTAGITRISPAEAVAAGQSPEWATRWNAWAQKASKGQLSAEMAKEGNALMDILSQGAHKKLIQQQQVIAARGIDPGSIPSADADGNVTTLDTQLPKGARGKSKGNSTANNVPVSTGKAAKWGTPIQSNTGAN